MQFKIYVSINKKMNTLVQNNAIISCELTAVEMENINGSIDPVRNLCNQWYAGLVHSLYATHYAAVDYYLFMLNSHECGEGIWIVE
jgi:hypothetical protein